MARHIHCELIKAWADGAEIEYKSTSGNWRTITPIWNPDMEYRIKPRIVKREGWVNVYRNRPGGYMTGELVYDSKKDASNGAMDTCVVATVKIEWEESE